MEVFLFVAALVLWGFFVPLSKRKAAKPRGVPYSREAISLMKGHDFERYCAGLLRYNGYLNVTVTQGSGDRGVDIICEKDKKRYAVQCKRQAGKVGRRAVQEIYTGKAIYKCDVGVILTNADFSESAVKDAQELGIELWCGIRLKQLHNFDE